MNGIFSKKIALAVIGACVALPLLLKCETTTPASSMARHRWMVISFKNTEDKFHPEFSLRPDDKGKGLAFYVDFTPSVAVKDHGVTARLFREGGEVVESVGGDLSDPQPEDQTMSPSVPGKNMKSTDQALSAQSSFPWGKNILEGAWIRVSIAQENYWLEVPYGFDRDPKDPLPPAIPGKAPKPLAAFAKFSSHDHLVPWTTVSYDLGTIQNGWQLTFDQSNDGDGKTEVVLYRDDSAIGKSMYLWNLHSPATRVQAIDSDGTVIDSIGINIHLDEDGFRREDSFNMNRYGFDDMRCWGKIEVTVGAKSYRTVIPSSLYKFMHGHAS
jgi:hypothetical protein